MATLTGQSRVAVPVFTSLFDASRHPAYDAASSCPPF